MNHLPLLQQAFSGIRFHAEMIDFFEERLVEINCPKGSFLTEAGKPERYFYLVLEGIQIIYLISEKGEKVVLGFSYTGSFSGVYDSFLHGNPSDYFLESLTESQLLGLPRSAYDELFERFPEFDRWGRIFHQEILLGRIKREVELLTLPAEARFRKFMDRCPPILRTIPQKYLASYLHMTPETFSRLRRRKEL